MNIAEKISEREFIQGKKIGGKNPFFLIAGPCVMESKDLLDRVCGELCEYSKKLGLFFIFKSSFDKANRSSVHSFRGPGIYKGREYLEFIKKKYEVPVLTDIHETSHVEPLKDVVDLFQIPAFLCRQTDLLSTAASSGKWVNVKKGQFMAPADTNHIQDKFKECGSQKLLITERGASFGYNNLVVDPRSVPIIHGLDLPFVFDATHSAQLPGGGMITGGQREMIPYLSQSLIAMGIEGLFMEVHPDPPNAKSDATTQFYLKDSFALLEKLAGLDRYVKGIT